MSGTELPLTLAKLKATAAKLEASKDPQAEADRKEIEAMMKETEAMRKEVDDGMEELYLSQTEDYSPTLEKRMEIEATRRKKEARRTELKARRTEIEARRTEIEASRAEIEARRTEIAELSDNPRTPAGLPSEISHMDERSIQIFQEAINQGKYKSYSIRLMIIGPFGAGKTTLTKRLLDETVDITSYDSTDGIEIYDHHCSYNREEKKWMINQGSQDNTECRDLAETLQKHGIKNIITNSGQTDVSEGGSRTSKEDIYQSSAGDNDQEQTGSVEADRSYRNISKPLNDEEIKRRKLIYKIKQEDVIDQNTLDDIHIWDFGGQVALYCTHQGFLSHRAVYLLVVDLSKDLHCLIEEEGLDTAKRRKCTVKEYVRFWVNSVKFYTGGKDGLPRIIVIGTHLNDVLNTTVAEKLQALFEEIRSSFKKEIESGQIILRESFMLDLINNDQSRYDKIRQEISDEAEKQPHWGEDLPMSWLPLQHYLNEERKKKSQILPIEEVVKYVASDKMTEALDVREKLDVCLRFLHSSGNIMYYSRPGLNTHLILNPKMLITTLRSLITCRQFCKSENRQEIYDRLADSGEVSQESIETIWKEEGFEEMYKHKEYLIKVMQKLDLLIMPKQYKGGDVVDGHTFYIPAMIKTMPPTWTEEIVDAEDLTHCIFDFTKSFLPPAVSFRFIGSCISMWPAATTESLFFGGCYLEIDDWHRMLITTGNNQIRVTFEHWEDNKYLSRNTTNNVMDIMTEMLKSIIALYPVKDGNTSDMNFSVDKSSVENLKTEENTTEHCVDCEGPTADLLKKRPSVLQMMRFSKLWHGAKDGHRLFATHLGVQQCDQDTIEHDHDRNLPMKVFGYCFKWYNNVAGKKSFSTLLEAASSYAKIDKHIVCKIMRDASDHDQMRQIKRKILEDSCTAEVIDRIPNYIGKEYYHFGLEMGLDLHELDEIVHGHKEKLAKIIAAILKTAIAKSKRGRLSIRKVACALLQVGRGFTDFKDLVNGKEEDKCGRW